MRHHRHQAHPVVHHVHHVHAVGTADPSTLSLADHVLAGAGAALGLVTLVFGATVVLRHDARSDRVWLTGFMAALAVVASPLLLREDGAGRLEPGITALAAAYAVYALWAGARVFADRPAYTAEGMTASVLVGLLALGLIPHADVVGSIVMGILCLGLLAVAVEVWRGPMRANLNAHLLILGCVGVGIAGLLWSPYVGRDGWPAASPGWSAPLIVASGTTGVYVVAGLTLTALRVERHGVWWAISEDHSLRRLGLLGPEGFEANARDRIQRSSAGETPVTLLLVRIDDLAELNAAFGRQAGDAALAFVAGVLRAQVPPSALIGLMGGATFGVVSSRSPEALIAALQTGMLGTALPATLEMRVSVSYGSATAARCGYDYQELRSCATDTLATDRRA